jgi:hypothetical protein
MPCAMKAIRLACGAESFGRRSRSRAARCCPCRAEEREVHHERRDDDRDELDALDRARRAAEDVSDLEVLEQLAGDRRGDADDRRDAEDRDDPALADTPSATISSAATMSVESVKPEIGCSTSRSCRRGSPRRAEEEARDQHHEGRGESRGRAGEADVQRDHREEDDPMSTKIVFDDM